MCFDICYEISSTQIFPSIETDIRSCRRFLIYVIVQLTREVCTVPLIATYTSCKKVFETPVVVITLVMFDVAALIVVLHCSVIHVPELLVPVA